MECPRDQQSSLADIIRKRKKLLCLTSIPFLVMALIALLARMTSGRFPGIPFSVAGPAAMVVFLFTLFLHALIWRCPACNGHLGIYGSTKFCPKCGIKLDADLPRESGLLQSPDRKRNPGSGFKIWTAALSVFVAALLFPNILRKHGAAKSLVITVLAVGAIWLMYFVIGLVIDAAVSEELKRRSHKKTDDSEGPRP